MDTLTTIEAVERTPSGAYKITLLGDQVAGTFDESIGELAVEAHAEDAPVGVRLSKRQGKLFIDFLEKVEAPPELGGPEETKTAEEPQVAVPVEEGEAKHGLPSGLNKPDYEGFDLSCGIYLSSEDLGRIADQLLAGMIPIEQA